MSLKIETLEARRLLAGESLVPSGLIRTIEGTTFEQEGNLNLSPGFGTIPPSPSTAAGPNHVVSAINSAITFHTKAGVKTYESNLFDFYQNQPFSGLYDTRVNYDARAGRWIVVAVDKTEAPSVFGNRSSLFIAVSDDADPNGAWNVSFINSRLTIGGAQHWADNMNVGLDTAGALYITANMHRFDNDAYGGTRLWIVDEAQLLAGTLAFTVHDPFAATGVAGNEAGLAPTRFYSRGNVSGNFLLNAGGFTTGLDDQIAVIRVTNPLSATPTFARSLVSMGGNVDNEALPLPGAQQSGSLITIRTGDRMISSAALWHDGQLFFTNTILPTSGVDATQATVRWYRAATSGPGSPPILTDSGNIGGEEVGAGTHTFFSALSADTNGNFVVGYHTSGPTTFASAAFSIGRIVGGVGTTEAPVVYAAGQDFYVRTYVTPPLLPQNNLWGTFSSASLDQTDGSFWIMQQYAGPRGGEFQLEDGRWRTRVANVGVGTPNPPSAPDLAASSDNGSSQTDNVTNDNTPTITGTGPANTTIRIFSGNTEVGSTTSLGDGSWSLDISLPAGDYTTTLVAVAENANGRSVDSPPLTVRIDTIAPTLSATPTFEFETTHALRYVFSENVESAAMAGDVIVTRAGMPPTMFSPTGRTYDTGTNTATFTFVGLGPPPGILADGNYSAAVSTGSVEDLAGNALTAPAPLDFFVFAGDATRDRNINIMDFSLLASNFNTPGTFSDGDFNYNGQVEIGDFSILASKFNTSLPLARAAANTGSSRGFTRMNADVFSRESISILDDDECAVL